MVRIKGDNGEWLEDEESIIGRFGEFYRDLFKSNSQRSWGIVMDYVPQLVIEEVNKEVVKEINEKEIKVAIYQLGTYKAPGPNGFNGFFYQQYWEIVRKDVIEVVKGFFRSERMLRELNAVEIVLIPKVKGSKMVGQFKSISLCNCAYKVISKLW